MSYLRPSGVAPIQYQNTLFSVGIVLKSDVDVDCIGP